MTPRELLRRSQAHLDLAAAAERHLDSLPRWRWLARRVVERMRCDAVIEADAWLRRFENG